MQRIRLTRKRVVIEVAFVIIGVIIMDRTFFYRSLQTSFENKPFFLLVIFISSVTIGFGCAVMASFPIKTFLKSIIVLGLWAFLFVLPIWLSPLPEEVSILSISFSLLLLILLIAYYKKWKKEHKKDSLHNTRHF